MKKNHIFLILISIIALFLTSCELKDDASNNDDGTDSVYTVTLNGSVVESATGNGISGATVRISDGLTVKGATTNNDGVFTSTIEATQDVDLVVIGSKDGYLPDTTSVFAIIGQVTQVPFLQLTQDSNGGGGVSGGAASINLFSQSAQSVGVKESGALESAELVFEVRDSSGTLIDASSAVNLSFSFGATPGGGEYLYPSSVTTNALGKGSVTLNTGTVAGVVQVIAEASISGQTIRSKPILIAIHGGFPVDDLFYVACEKLNYPALGVIGFDIDFTAYVGDKYNNPVRPGTAVYFTANYGIIGGSNLTGESGTTSVKLLTEPWPSDSEYGNGFFRVTAATADENLNTITTETVRLLSGAPIVSVSPTTFDLDNGGSQTFTYIVRDVNGNPMAEGQTIDVSIESEFIDVAGGVSFKLPDTQSSSWTSFSFMAFDTNADTIHVEAANIEIKTAGPNSEVAITIGGVGR